MSLYREAIERIQVLLEQARLSKLREPMAMSLATTDLQGRPSVRTVLLKKVDERGLIFFTNTRSSKGQHLYATPYAAICIYNQDAHQQIQVSGSVEPVTTEEANAYWQTRPRASQLGAWASRQSEVLADRQQLHDRIARYDTEYAGMEVPRPPHWSGYRIVPERMEFWGGHPDRLNQRECYSLRDGHWSRVQLYP